MSGTELRQRLGAILAADAAGYSRLMSVDEGATVAALDAAREVFKSQIQSRQGRVIDTAGDSVLAVFETAAGAVEAALAIQRELDVLSRDVPEDRRMRFRIGVHLGDVIEKADGTIYGAGVNIAARLQALAEPGGISVSDAIRGSVKSRLAVEFADLGEQHVKNIADPVHAYLIRLKDGQAPAASARSAPKQRRARRLALASAIGVIIAAGAGGAFWWRSPSTTPGKGALPLPGKPSIAVLPFDNMGGDPEQSYFADGMTEDLITDLSKVGGLFVIARNSTFAYKGKAHDIREIAGTLGVRYVLEGSVRRSGSEIRVNAQLIDATTGGHMWADRYDGDMKNIFALQDKVTRSVVGALAVELTKEDSERVARRGTENAEAYDVFLKGWHHYLSQTPEDFRAAILYFVKATELDPQYGRAYAALAAVHWEIYRRYWDWNDALRMTRPYLRAEKFLAKAMTNPTPLGHEIASAILTYRRAHAEAMAEATSAIAEDPNDADGYVALSAALSFAGKPREALEMVGRAIRLNPHYPPYYLYQQGLAQFGMKNLKDAATSLERALALQREDYWSERLLLATYGLLGRREDAAKLIETINGSNRRGPHAYQDPLTVKGVAFWYPFANAGDADYFADGLRRAGLPE